MKEALSNRERPEVVNPTFVLLFGPSGVGKSTLIKSLQREDERFKFVSPITDRVLRTGETEKVSVSAETFTELEENDMFLLVNNIYGHRYGTPKSTVDEIFQDGNIPILDFPIDQVSKLQAYRDLLYKVYIVPPSLGTLSDRLDLDTRAQGNTRYQEARSELLGLVRNHFQHPDIDDVVINRNIHVASKNLLSLVYKRISVIK